MARVVCALATDPKNVAKTTSAKTARLMAGEYHSACSTLWSLVGHACAREARLESSFAPLATFFSKSSASGARRQTRFAGGLHAFPHCTMDPYCAIRALARFTRDRYPCAD